jgi:D-alanine-D-alanine ligase
MKKLRVGILFGGRSAEHEVSLMSARNVLLALDPERYQPVLIGIDRSGHWSLQEPELLLGAPVTPPAALPEADESVALQSYVPGSLVAGSADDGGAARVGVDVVFPVLHGPMGEDGTVQGLLELANIPYVGAGVLGSAVGMDKDVMKRLLREAGLPVAAFHAFRRWDHERDPAGVAARCAELGFPQFVKPANLGSSVGITRVADPADLDRALRFAFQFDTKVLVERGIVGREIECSVLGYRDPIASIPGEIVVRHRDGFYSYDAKYIDESGAALEIPARLDPATVEAVQRMSIRAFTVLECQGLARVDFFLGPSGELTINEINTLPGFTAISMYPKLWEASGVSPRELVSRLIELAFERHRDRAALRSRQD